MGQECQGNKVNHKNKKTSSYFDVNTCRACPHSQDCPVKITKRKAKVEWNWSKPRLELRRLIFEQDQDTIELFRLRSGGEAVMSETKNTLGLRRLRVRGFAKAELAILLAVTGLNIKRLFNWFVAHQGSSASKFWANGSIRAFLTFFSPVENVNWPQEAKNIGLAA